MSNLMQPADLKTLREKGVIIAANVEFFHALGLNLDIVVKDGVETPIITRTDDEEGVLYSSDVPERVNKLITDSKKKFDDLRKEKHSKREKTVGFLKQQLA